MSRIYTQADREVNIKLAGNLRERRLKLKIKSKDAAIHCGVSFTTYSNWEHAISTPPYRTIIRLADLYSCSIDYLFKNEADIDTLFADSRRDLGQGKKPPRRIIGLPNNTVVNNSKSNDGEESGVQVDDSDRSYASR